MGGRKQEEHIEDAERLRTRFSQLLKRLVTTVQGDDRIDRKRLALKLSDRLDGEYGAPLRRYVAGQECPRAEIAWNLGESLHEVAGQIKWGSGLMMLYATGRLRDFAGVVLCYLYTPLGPVSCDSVRAIRAIVQCVDDLVISTEVDFDRELIGFHRECAPPDAIKSALGTAFERRGASEHFRDVVEKLWLFRENAKADWSRADSIRHDLNDAFARWSSAEEESIPSEFLPILTVARATDIDYFDREHEVLKMLDRYFDDFLEAEQVVPKAPP